MPNSPDRNRRHDDQRLGRFETQLNENAEALARIENHLAEINGTITDVVIEVGGIPGSLGRDPKRPSLRARVHELEQAKYAATAVNAALGMLFGRTAKVALIAFAGLGALFSGLRLLGIGG